MTGTYTEGESLRGKDFSTKPLSRVDYEDCLFLNCNFANTDLSHSTFVECEFVDCDLSTVKLVNTAFREVRFKSCKLLGLHFENCNDFLFAVNFEACQLNLSSFYQRSLKDTLFKDCSLQETDFTEADLSNANLNNCNLKGAIFENTVLEKADLRTSYHYSIDPDINKITKAKFSLQGLRGLLDKYDIIIEA